MDAHSDSTARLTSLRVALVVGMVSFRFLPARRSVPRTSRSMRRRVRSPSASANVPRNAASRSPKPGSDTSYRRGKRHVRCEW